MSSSDTDREIARRTLLRSGVALGAGALTAPVLLAATARAAPPRAPAAPPRAPAALPREQRFDLEVEGRVVPGIVWHPRDAEGPTPLVLAGHGGGFGTEGHKRVEGIVALAAALADHGIATLAIDQPGCGDRPGAAEEQARRRGLSIEQAIAELWTPALVEEMARDWQACLAHARGVWGLGEAGVGYWGLSGGTTFGLPLVALEPRIEAAVLGLNSAVPLMLAYAPRVTCPVLYTMNLDDHFMTREQGLALFDALASDDKLVVGVPGDHGENLDRVRGAWVRFFAARLGARPPGADR